MNLAWFRFYEELNDFLPPSKRKQSFPYSFHGNPSLKDAIEAIGVPHVEVDLILVNYTSASFSQKLENEDYVSVYPVFEFLNVDEVSRVRRKPLRKPAFILDTHLGKLCRYRQLRTGR